MASVNNDSNSTSALLDHLVRTNMRTISEIRKQARKNRNFQERLADLITSFSGDMKFVYLHILWFLFWIALNTGITPFKSFDPYPFGLLTMIVSLEAIFLSTFVLISQNRLSAMTEERADLDLHIDLLAEHEITKVLKIVDAIAKKVGVAQEVDAEIAELEQQVTPDEVLAELRRQT